MYPAVYHVVSRSQSHFAFSVTGAHGCAVFRFPLFLLENVAKPPNAFILRLGPHSQVQRMYLEVKYPRREPDFAASFNFASGVDVDAEGVHVAVGPAEGDLKVLAPEGQRWEEGEERRDGRVGGQDHGEIDEVVGLVARGFLSLDGFFFYARFLCHRVLLFGLHGFSVDSSSFKACSPGIVGSFIVCSASCFMSCFLFPPFFTDFLSVELRLDDFLLHSTLFHDLPLYGLV